MPISESYDGLGNDHYYNKGRAVIKNSRDKVGKNATSAYPQKSRK